MTCLIKNILLLCCLLAGVSGYAQLSVNSNTNADALAQALAGDGVKVFNVRFTGNILMAGTFINEGNTNIPIDTGIVLTTGSATSGRDHIGVDGTGFNTASSQLASYRWGLPGDTDIANELTVMPDQLKDACVLEFDFIPIGDSISFKYVFSSEEYVPLYVCSFNDAFAFFISGPGYARPTNIALVPGTNIPVSIFNVNNVPDVNGVPACANNTGFYIDNSSNMYMNHDGHTTLLSAKAKVTSCQVYHLKLVITDAVDDQYDSGVFLQSKSLVSNKVQLTALTPVDASGKPYIVEGCTPGRLKISKTFSNADPVTILLQYSGTADNGQDITPLPLTVTLAPGQREILLNLSALTDNIDEGIETLRISAFYNCDLNNPVLNDTLEIQIRDYAPLVITPSRAMICGDIPLRITAAGGYNSYQWDTDTTLSSLIINNPLAKPVLDETWYYCTASTGTCKARDSARIQQKRVLVIDTIPPTCSYSADGALTISGGPEWIRPLSFSFNGRAFGTDSVFTGLRKGSYIVMIRDAAGCAKKMNFFLNQRFTDPVITQVDVLPATCSGLPDGVAQVMVSGGVQPFYYATDTNFYRSSDTFNLVKGNYTAYVKDSAGCISAPQSFTIPFSSRLNVISIPDTTICEGNAVILQTESISAESFHWTPALYLNNDTLQNPVATPAATMKYYVTATKGICSGHDSVSIKVLPAPVPDAGRDTAICYHTSAILKGTGAPYLQWSPAALLDNDSSATPLTDSLVASTYFVLHATGSNGCPSIIADSVLVTVRPPALISLGKDTIVAIDQPLQLIARDVNNSGLSQFVWEPATGLSATHLPSVTAVLQTDSIEYTVSAQTPEGCSSRDSIRVKTYRGPWMYVASAFTPNNDGRNDVLHILAAGFRNIYYFNVYNRWGELVFSTTDPARGWNGFYKGKPAATGVYAWVAEGLTYLGRKVSQKGTVVLLR